MVTTGNTSDNPIIEASPIPRMQDLQVQVETPQMTTIVKKCTAVGNSRDREDENKEMEEFEAFNKYKEMKKQCEEKENQKRKRSEKDCNHIYVHSDQTSGSSDRYNKGKDEDTRRGDERGKKVLLRAEHAKEYHKVFGRLNFRSPFTDEINNTQSRLA
ncbi:unnamed protein product [Lactuca saligna]|uniref:Uncharacterized protein n=1 Tax=Lactuca saligna TaxID=75948 RepID=A0AA35YUY0_LACSI|nr:unnamed protein product [Lactuca saligna]